MSFTSVAAFVLARDAVVLSQRFGPLSVDLAYGGAFYAILPAAELGLDLEASPLGRIVEAAMEVKAAAAGRLAITHPDTAELGFLYGTILTDGEDGLDAASTNVCVFADGQVDRSPTGSGVTARMALLHRRGRARPGETCRFRSLTGAEFEAEIAGTARCGPHPAVTVRVSGRAYYTGGGQLHGRARRSPCATDSSCGGDERPVIGAGRRAPEATWRCHRRPRGDARPARLQRGVEFG